jgi:hypothetical protein
MYIQKSWLDVGLVVDGRRPFPGKDYFHFILSISVVVHPLGVVEAQLGAIFDSQAISLTLF